MAQMTLVTVLCDLPHDSEAEGTESVSFGLDGAEYEIDLCGPHGKELRAKIGVFANRARGTTAGSRRRKARTSLSRARNAEIRDWARQRGHHIGERGRIPASITAEYDQVH